MTAQHGLPPSAREGSSNEARSWRIPAAGARPAASRMYVMSIARTRLGLAIPKPLSKLGNGLLWRSQRLRLGPGQLPAICMSRTQLFSDAHTSSAAWRCDEQIA